MAWIEAPQRAGYRYLCDPTQSSLARGLWNLAMFSPISTPWRWSPAYMATLGMTGHFGQLHIGKASIHHPRFKLLNLNWKRLWSFCSAKKNFPKAKESFKNLLANIWEIDPTYLQFTKHHEFYFPGSTNDRYLKHQFISWLVMQVWIRPLRYFSYSFLVLSLLRSIRQYD